MSDIERLLDRVVIDPHVMTGKPVIRGTRIPVELIIRMLAQGLTEEELLGDYPRLVRDDIRAALAYAAGVVAGETIIPLTAPAS